MPRWGHPYVKPIRRNALEGERYVWPTVCHAYHTRPRRVFQHWPLERACQLLCDVAGAHVSTGTLTDWVRAAADELCDFDARLRALLVAAPGGARRRDRRADRRTAGLAARRLDRHADAVHRARAARRRGDRRRRRAGRLQRRRGAECANSARSDLCGGRPKPKGPTAVPTAILVPARPRAPHCKHAPRASHPEPTQTSVQCESIYSREGLRVHVTPNTPHSAVQSRFHALASALYRNCACPHLSPWTVLGRMSYRDDLPSPLL